MARKGVKPGDRPVGVAIVNRATGVELPCELAYEGVDAQGQHVWRAASDFDPNTEKVTIKLLPARTTIVFGAPDE